MVMNNMFADIPEDSSAHQCLVFPAIQLKQVPQLLALLQVRNLYLFKHFRARPGQERNTHEHSTMLHCRTWLALCTVCLLEVPSFLTSQQQVKFLKGSQVWPTFWLGLGVVLLPGWAAGKGG